MHSQKGFSVVEGLVILLVLGLITGAGFFVWQRQKQSKSPTNNTSTNSAITVQGNKKQSATVSYTATDTGFTFKAPANWERIDGRGLIVRFRSPTTDKEGSTFYQANIQVHSEDYSGTLSSYARAQAAAERQETAEITSIEVSEESSSTTNGISVATYEKIYTLAYDNTRVHCLNVMHIGKGKALDISACSLASKWDSYKNTYMQGLLGYAYSN